VTPRAPKPEAIVARLLKWFSENARDLPWRRASDPYAIWISEIMLQQTQVKTVIPYYERWMREVPDVRTLARLPAERLHKLWEGLGYYTRVRNLQRAAILIKERHGGRFPDALDQILALPGVGRYTAGAIASIAFNQAAPILDGNVTRVLCRLFGLAGDPGQPALSTKLWLLAEALVRQARKFGPGAFRVAAEGSAGFEVRGSCSALNQALMELGATLCTRHQPDCRACPISPSCVARREQRVEQLPTPRTRPKTTVRKLIVLLVEDKGRFLVRRRPEGVVNAQLWEFPNYEPLNRDVRDPLANNGRFQAQRLGVVRHSITRYRMQFEVHRVRRGPGTALPDCAKGKWLTPPQIDPLPLASAHRKIFSRYVLPLV
jgi:A/G-specific adenine glycosylase